VIGISIAWLSLSARMPTLDEIQAVRKENGSASAFKDMARACVPNLSEVLRLKPAAGPKIGMLVFAASGTGAEVRKLGEDELDGEMAVGYVEAEKKGFGALHPISVEHRGEQIELILREPREVECDAIAAKESARAFKALIDKITVWGAKDFQDRAPGLYVALGIYILEAVGLNEEATLGEA